MKYTKFLAALLLTGLSILALTSFRNASKPGKEKDSDAMTNTKGFAVLELFTSEGCSSCPPADELMAKIQNEYKEQPVYLLVFHVDYWDRQGWKDVFSSHDYTNRQLSYQNWLGINSIYTPQLVVNGKAEFVGSDEFKIRSAINTALNSGYSAQLSVQSNQDKNKFTLNYEVSNGPEDSRLLVAIVQKSASTKVERGENKGRLLSHVQIVRSLTSVSLSGAHKGTATISLPAAFNAAAWEVIAMVQDVNKGEIATAARVNL